MPGREKRLNAWPFFDPVIFHARAYDVALLNDRPFVRFRMTKDLLRLQIAGQGKITIGEVRADRGKRNGKEEQAQRDKSGAGPQPSLLVHFIHKRGNNVFPS